MADGTVTVPDYIGQKSNCGGCTEEIVEVQVMERSSCIPWRNQKPCDLASPGRRERRIHPPGSSRADPDRTARDDSWGQFANHPFYDRADEGKVQDSRVQLRHCSFAYSVSDSTRSIPTV